MDYARILVPHACFFIDTTFKSMLENFETLAYSCEDSQKRKITEEDLGRIWRDGQNETNIMSCLSVRSAFDLFLRVKSFPPGSEIIMSAINIPSMVRIVTEHKLSIVACDIDVDTLQPSATKLESLITDKTVAVLVAYIYGKRCNMTNIINVCKRHNLYVLEDCAEAFSGLTYKGHPESDITLFSFGTIKYATVFGGSVVRVNNRNLYNEMKKLHDTYCIQPWFEYAKKLIKCSFIAIAFNWTVLFKYGIALFRALGLDHKEIFVPLLRGFPNNFFANIRRRPSLPLLINLALALSRIKKTNGINSKSKGDYVSQRLPHAALAAGQKSDYVNYWLYPILVEKPMEVSKCLNDLGVDATRGTTQLKCVFNHTYNSDDDISKPDKSHTDIPHAKFIMDHVVYLPVSRRVSYSDLDQILNVLGKVLHNLKCKPLVPPPGYWSISLKK